MVIQGVVLSNKIPKCTNRGSFTPSVRTESTPRFPMSITAKTQGQNTTVTAASIAAVKVEATDEWIHKTWFTPTVEYHSTLKRKF